MNSAPEEMGKVATVTVEAMRTQPLALALILINVLFLIVGGYVLHDIVGTQRERAASPQGSVAR